MPKQPTFGGLFMAGETCELCGYMDELWAIEPHHIVPKELTSKAGMPDSATVTLCSNCHREVHTWYSKKVFNMTYDPAVKRFRPKSLVEMVKEYETAYRIFAEYKKWQQEELRKMDIDQ